MMDTMTNTALLQAQASHSHINEAKFAATSQEFEAVFIAEMMKPMFEGLDTNGMFGGGKAEEIFRGMLLTEYGKEIAKTGAIGMTSDIKAELLRMQEEANQ